MINIMYVFCNKIFKAFLEGQMPKEIFFLYSTYSLQV